MLIVWPIFLVYEPADKCKYAIIKWSMNELLCELLYYPSPTRRGGMK